jgi:hypothetical protein
MDESKGAGEIPARFQAKSTVTVRLVLVFPIVTSRKYSWKAGSVDEDKVNNRPE